MAAFVMLFLWGVGLFTHHTVEHEGTKVDAMARLEQAYEQCAASVQ